jgi:ketosteroid isomerase-like protein
VDTAAELEIRNLSARFTDAVNRRASTDLAGLFVEDGTWHVPGVPTVVGQPAIAAQLDTLLTNFERLIQLGHSGHVEVAGDTAKAVWYLTELAQDAAGNGFAFTGVYTDELVRTGEGWRFTERRFDFLFRARVEFGAKWYAHPAAVRPADAL